jgi:hypothetical protein
VSVYQGSTGPAKVSSLSSEQVRVGESSCEHEQPSSYGATGRPRPRTTVASCSPGRGADAASLAQRLAAAE